MGKKKHIGLFRPLLEEEILGLADIIDPNAIFYVENPKLIPSQFEKHEVALTDFSDLRTKIKEQSFAEVVNFGHDKIINGKPLVERLMFNNNSMWYYIRFMVYNNLNSNILEFEKCTYFLKKLDVEDTLFYTLGTHKGLGIPCIGLQKPAIKHYKNLFLFAIIFLIRGFKGFFQLSRIKKARFGLITNATDQQPVLDRESLKVLRGSHFTEYLQEDIEKEPDFVNLSEIFPLRLFSNEKLALESRFLKSKFSNQFNLEYVFYRAFFRPLLWLKMYKMIREFNRNWAKIIETSDIEIIRPITPFKNLIRFILLRKICLTSFFSKYGLEALGGTNEQDPKVKCILECAENLGIRSFGIQHGVIHKNHMFYVFNEKDAPYRPYPTKTLLWGSHWLEELLNCSHYDPNALVAAGQIRTDIIPFLKHSTYKETLEGYSKDKKVLFYPSQPLYVGEETVREQVATDVFKYMKNRDDILLVIKPHPAEHDHVSFFKQIADKTGNQNYQIINSDLYLLLEAADWVIIYNSTVGAEACYFGKDLAMMNYYNNDYSGFISSGIAMEINNSEEFAAKMDDFLAGKTVIPTKNKMDFTVKHVGEVHSSSTQSYIQEIRKLGETS